MAGDKLGSVRDGFVLLEDGFWIRISAITAVKDLQESPNPAGIYDSALARGNRSVVYCIGQDDANGGARLTTIEATQLRAIVSGRVGP